jgi:hypothetical protein
MRPDGSSNILARRFAMQRTMYVATSVLTGMLLMAAPSFAAQQGVLPPEKTQGAVTYVSGGVGTNEIQAFQAAATHYPLTLEFAIKHRPRAEFTADVQVTLTNAQGQRVLETRSDGPFLLAKLPAGQYTVTAEHSGQTLTKTVRVDPHRPAHAMFLWAA